MVVVDTIGVLFNPSILALIKGLVGVVILLAVISLNVLFLTWMERKVIARIQVRYGPNRAGPFGLLQPLADVIKLLFKEDIIPQKADRAVFTLAPAIAFTVAFLPALAIPFGEGLIVSDLNIGILYIVAVSALATIPVIMAGWSSNNKYSLLGGMRSAAQSISYEIPLGLSIIGVVALAGSLSMVTIVERQATTWLYVIPTWFIFLQPIGFAVFFLAALAEMARIPFDLPEAESCLVAGFHTEYGAMKFAMLLFAEYIHMVIASALMVILFLGGWHGPGLSLLPIALLKVAPASIAGALSPILVTLLSLFYFFAKLYAVIFVLMWIRATLPRVRIDQLLDIGWKVLLPLALLNIAITGIAIVAPLPGLVR
jgi:NADH-quinone oxidoreductase subunit H